MHYSFKAELLQVQVIHESVGLDSMNWSAAVCSLQFASHTAVDEEKIVPVLSQCISSLLDLNTSQMFSL